MKVTYQILGTIALQVFDYIAFALLYGDFNYEHWSKGEQGAYLVSAVIIGLLLGRIAENWK